MQRTKIGGYMNNQTFEEWTTVTNNFADWQKIYQDAYESMVRECIAFGTDNSATAVKCAQTFQRINGPEDFANNVTKLSVQQLDKALEFAKNIFQIYYDTMKNHLQLTENKVNSAVKNATRVKKQEEK